jgi:hypothetical protein
MHATLGILAMLTLTATLSSQADPQAEVAALEQAYWDAHELASTALHAVLDTDEESARRAEYDAMLADHRERFAAFAGKNDGEAAVAAWTWVANLGWRADDAGRTAARAAVARLLADHLRSAALGGLVNRLSYLDGALSPAECSAGLRRIAAATPHPEIRAKARLQIVRVLIGGDPPGAEARAEARELLDALLGDAGGEQRVVDEARLWQYELDHLQLGMVAPDFEAEDQHGKSFKLSDYRGKIVVLDWWGFW